MSGPVLLQWNGEAFEPANRHWARECDKRFVVGEFYTLAEHNDRSKASHNHYFAAVAEAWQNLPEIYAGMSFAESSEHLRAYALIKKGYCDTHTIVCSSKAEAKRLAAFIRPIDAFSVVDVKEATVTRYVAKSQSMKAMDKQEFQESKTAVLDYLDDLIGVERGTTQRNAGAAA
ncbi:MULTISPECIES: hypothetical protein [Sinorhizobium]|uniref:hypothetical protein n=1 Tax=Sinorhizobium TaxID=28105 RepID=UPI000B4A2B54|nr:MULTISPECIES: hypothetical protein [Sinorhizobium]ASP85042.1 hypothetical protein CDO26_10830 [Sinorhizobium meliloti]MDW9473180.1 hypothetical protein [Sinorhizobium meliloti]MQW28456.1 hypothetical protein [Sinorhizobium meliloti]RVJ77586.1 hypothetical protein CN171_06820 [Sinorhizobium meliloti]WQO53847.1 hypothetical protein U8C36_09820 [Sinorhizobium medicae]